MSGEGASDGAAPPTLPAPSTIHVNFRLFAKARDAAGVNKCRLQVQVDGHGAVVATLSAALKALVAAHPKLEGVLPSCSLALNEEFVVAATVATASVRDGDTLAILPPVSGG
jgi:molybdopterin converting factor small subunit